MSNSPKRHHSCCRIWTKCSHPQSMRVHLWYKCFSNTIFSNHYFAKFAWFCFFITTIGSQLVWGLPHDLMRTRIKIIMALLLRDSEFYRRAASDLGGIWERCAWMWYDPSWEGYFPKRVPWGYEVLLSHWFRSFWFRFCCWPSIFFRVFAVWLNSIWEKLSYSWGWAR